MSSGHVGLGFFPCAGKCGLKVLVLKTSERARKWRFQKHIIPKSGGQECPRSGTNLDAVELLALLDKSPKKPR